ncbi:Acetoin:2,6-dichlorophenolindophenol oxidoreductase subunit alpha [Anatilimnocola aggregata]|uniref:Acetoin:2,6-dichlorophenolindophenol oxidoreductase subunit alpha n=1 Tax=Anatilimnocola aggregata TaxID=2528021 RepID=A0A517Y421_9BACT|nr:pyruvate dehydrogenase complex E1 component subunit beta [Anatilimnocola aggregata]QDU24999.1 Acetoin:2,6-dichlorophenolindophenol oxidoreductase subunit alpha [Anatilimnocola aggregata]
MNQNQPLSDEQILALYRTMQTIRLTEEELARCHQRGLIHGACHTYVGQEAIATGVCAHLTSNDCVFSTHRGHGHALAKGMPPRELIAELFGRATGCSRGRGGSMHLFSPEIGMMGTSGIVGPCILQACGGGYSSKILKNGTVGVAFFGDGAVNNGAFHEGINMASIWKLPVLFICENNQYATEVPFSYSSGIPDVGRRAANYGIPGFEVDGNDVVEVHRVLGEAIDRARQGGGPTLIECKTYRTRAHAEGMGDFTYRTREEVADWKEKCPIARLRTAFPDLVTEFDRIDQEVATLVQESRDFAEASPAPDSSTATDYVYSIPPFSPPPPPPPPPADCPLPSSRTISFVAATREALDQAMAANPTIFVMGQGIGVRGGNFTTTLGLHAKYGAERLCDVPICERGFVGLACGAAMSGTRPVVDFMFIDFINDSFGELVNQITKMQFMSSGRLKMPVLLRGCGGVGHSAATHHSGMYHSIYSHIPGLRVVIPSNPFDAKGLMAHALRSDDPVLFLEHRELMQSKGPVPENHYEIPFGQARVARAGSDVTIVALSFMVTHALSAAEQLASEGISVEIIDPRTVSPLDLDSILRSVAKTGRLLVVDEAFGPCGIASEIAAQVADAGFNDLDAPIKRLHGAFAPTPYAPSLEEVVVPNVARIVQAIRDLLEE